MRQTMFVGLYYIVYVARACAMNFPIVISWRPLVEIWPHDKQDYHYACM